MSPQPRLDPDWTLAASAFNWTPDVIRADRPATDITVGIIADGVADVVELEPGQLWPSFPATTDAEADVLRERLAAAGGRASIVGASLDDWASPTQRRSETGRLDFLLPQLHAARRVGAEGVRLPAGQAGPALLDRLLPHLHELGLTLYEEVQGQQTPSSRQHAAVYETVAALGDARIRLLVDISMLMPALPVSYLEQLLAGGIPSDLVTRLRDDWRDPATHDAVVALLRSDGVPPGVHTLYMNLLVRFGRSDAADLRGILPLVGAVHLKFWDLDDTDDRVSRPIRELARALAPTGFSGTLCSEWGGHEWLDDDPAQMTSAHLALARSALAQGAASVLA
ncbi:restriction endonuclease subunit R [Microbacterium sp. LMI12-1-1.1]